MAGVQKEQLDKKANQFCKRARDFNSYSEGNTGTADST